MAENERQDPLAKQETGQSTDDILQRVTGTVRQAQQARRPRQTPVRPSERRRRARKLLVTFSSPDFPRRLRALAAEWGMVAPDGKSAHVSALVEHLLAPQLDAAEAGAIDPPEG